jgi:hypothetical protein
MKWSEEEKEEFKRWLWSGWDFHFPGYEQAAMHLNRIFGNKRTASACRSMDRRINCKTAK